LFEHKRTLVGDTILKDIGHELGVELSGIGQLLGLKNDVYVVSLGDAQVWIAWVVHPGNSIGTRTFASAHV
jgi:hypothetical protein